MPFQSQSCPRCTAPMSPDSRFCAHCGATAAPPQPNWAAYTAQPAGYPAAAYYAQEQRTRVGQNLQSLGVLWCLFGAYRLLAGLIAFTAYHAVVHDHLFGDDMPPFITHGFGAILLPGIALTVLAMAGFSILVGLALLARKPWARTLAIVGGILALLKVPVGTALGIYTLWVMAPSAAGEEWARIQQP